MVEMSQSQRSLSLPFALSIGPRRCATSWIYRYLKARGDVCLPSGVKETRYFDRNYRQGSGFYHSHFKPRKRHIIAAEIGTTFFHHDDAPQRVAQHFGDHPLRLLCPLRHPIVRAYSEYHHMVRYGQIMPGLAAAIQDTPAIIQSSKYAQHIERWADTFGLDSLHFLFKETLDDDAETFTRDLCTLLDLPFMDITPATAPRYNATTRSKYPHLARGFQKYGDILRQYRLYAPINAAKKLGFKDMIFGRETAAPAPLHIPADDQRLLEDLLLPEVEKLEALLAPLPHWHLKTFTLAA